MNKIYGKLARNNIVNNRQLYVPYILSGMMTAALFYVINFLCGNPTGSDPWVRSIGDDPGIGRWRYWHICLYFYFITTYMRYQP